MATIALKDTLKAGSKAVLVFKFTGQLNDNMASELHAYKLALMSIILTIFQDFTSPHIKQKMAALNTWQPLR